MSYIKSLFNKHGLNFQRVSAIDRLDFTNDNAAQYKNILKNNTMKLGELACFLSHKKCWQKIVDNNLTLGAIFEDDIHLSSDAKKFLSDESWVPQNADIIKLETFVTKTKIDKKCFCKLGKRSLHRLRDKHAGAAGYIVTNAGAKKLLQFSKTPTWSVDQFMFNPTEDSFSQLVIYQITPALCVQDFKLIESTKRLNLQSDLHQARYKRKNRFRRLIVELAKPFIKFYKYIDGLIVNIFSKKQYIDIPFE